MAAVNIIMTAIAAELPVCPASSMLRTATEAAIVLVEYKNTTAEVVVKALINKYIAISSSTGKQHGNETFKKTAYIAAT
ncbi:hypothetical protein SAMN04488244_104131 [Vibrio hangzhouensis]|uniref:Uncharacterized protein n=1 Tax=Vibrio hangzhouensis TaxID=462991 RepID=A0A1H5VCE5_9VIBR|nr:hypothetical protein SAMN04488244_104131 [Vibrio hangzhouensis]